MSIKSLSVEATTRYTPGHLLAPFGWAADAVGAMVEAEPTLLFHLFELGRARMHLIALALAHLNEFSPDIGVFLANGSVRAVTERILGRCPTGIKRALNILPSRVMPPENYRCLVELLANPDTAKLLHHTRSIDSSKIEALHGFPPHCANLSWSMRSSVMAVRADFQMGFVCSCRAEPLRVLTLLCTNFRLFHSLDNCLQNSEISSKHCRYCPTRSHRYRLATHVGSIKP